MNRECSSCGHVFEREQGYFLGAIYVNYGLTAMIGLVIFFVTFVAMKTPLSTALIAMVVFSVIFPLMFFRLARSLWMAMDLRIDPPGSGDEDIEEFTRRKEP